MRLWIVDDRVPPESVALLREAARTRDVPVVHVHAPAFDWSTGTCCEPGDLLFRPAVSLASMQVERALWRPGVATFHRGPAGVLHLVADPADAFAHAGIPTPARIPCTARNRALLRRHVDHLGGLPVVVKVEGGEGGQGVMLADSWPVLHGLIDHLVGCGMPAVLIRYVPGGVHWRVVVVGDAVVAAYRNARQPDDFRTHPTDDPADYTGPCPPAVATAAVAATRAVGVEFAGVDVLSDDDGHPWVLEANFPCYFAQAEEVAGVPVAAAMLDHLVAKARHS